MNFDMFLSRYASPQLKARYSCCHQKNYLGHEHQFLQDVCRSNNDINILEPYVVIMKKVPDIMRLQEYQAQITSNIIDYIANPPTYKIKGHIGYNEAVIPFESGKSRVYVIHKGCVVMDCE